MYRLHTVLLLALGLVAAPAFAQKPPDPKAQADAIEKSLRRSLGGQEKSYFVVALVTEQRDTTGEFARAGSLVADLFLAPFQLLAAANSRGPNHGITPFPFSRFTADKLGRSDLPEYSVELVTFPNRKEAIEGITKFIEMERKAGVTRVWSKVQVTQERAVAERVATVQFSRLEKLAKQNPKLKVQRIPAPAKP